MLNAIPMGARFACLGLRPLVYAKTDLAHEVPVNNDLDLHVRGHMKIECIIIDIALCVWKVVISDHITTPDT